MQIFSLIFGFMRNKKVNLPGTKEKKQKKSMIYEDSDDDMESHSM